MRKELTHCPNLEIIKKDGSAFGYFTYWDITDELNQKSGSWGYGREQ